MSPFLEHRFMRVLLMVTIPTSKSCPALPALPAPHPMPSRTAQQLQLWDYPEHKGRTRVGLLSIAWLDVAASVHLRPYRWHDPRSLKVIRKKTRRLDDGYAARASMRDVQIQQHLPPARLDFTRKS